MSYYDPYPQDMLEQPLCLVGFMGCEIHSIAYFMSSLTGYPFVEVDKLVEHQKGMSIAQLYLEHGEETWRQCESEQIKVALSLKPARIICLGDGALLDSTNQSLCLNQSKVVYLRRPQQGLLKRIQQGRKENIQRYPFWLKREPKHADEVLALLKLREFGYEQAHTLIDIGELSALASAQHIIKRLKLNNLSF